MQIAAFVDLAVRLHVRQVDDHCSRRREDDDALPAPPGCVVARMLGLPDDPPERSPYPSSPELPILCSNVDAGVFLAAALVAGSASRIVAGMALRDDGQVDAAARHSGSRVRAWFRGHPPHLQAVFLLSGSALALSFAAIDATIGALLLTEPTLFRVGLLALVVVVPPTLAGLVPPLRSWRERPRSHCSVPI